MESITRVLVTGSTGLLGRAIVKILEKEYKVYGGVFSRDGKSQNPNTQYVKMDLTKDEDVIKCVDEIKPNVIVHSAAQRNPDKAAEYTEELKKLNVESTELLCDLSKKYNALLIYISTDAVFDGVKEVSGPDDPTNPLNVYGMTKLHSEEIVKSHNYDHSVILRIPVLYGELEYPTECSVTKDFLLIKDNSKSHSIENFSHRYATHVEDVAEAIHVIIHKYLESGPEGTTGEVYQFSAETKYTRYEFVKMIGEIFGFNTDHISPDDRDPNETQSVKRATKIKLDCTKYYNKFGYHATRTDIKKELEAILSPFVSK